MPKQFDNFKSYQDIKPAQLILAKFASWPLWPCFTVHADHLDVNITKSKRKPNQGPVPIMFLGDHSYTWATKDMLFPIRDEQLDPLMESTKDPNCVEAIEEALDLIEGEKNGLDRYEQLMRNTGLIEEEQEFEKPTDFGLWIDRFPDFKLKATKQLEDSQAVDLELLTGLKTKSHDKKDKTVIQTKPKSKKRATEEDEWDEKEVDSVTKESTGVNVKRRRSSKDDLKDTLSEAKLPGDKVDAKKISSTTSGLKKVVRAKKVTQLPRTSSPLTEQEHKLTPINANEGKYEEIKYLHPKESFKDLNDDEIEALCVIYRSSLQRALIQRDTDPSLDEYINASVKLEDVEKIEAEGRMCLKFLKSSKIHKVLKAMLRLEYKQPQEKNDRNFNIDNLKFKQRAEALLIKWEPLIQEIIGEKKKHQDMVPVYEVLNKNGTLRDPHKPTRKASSTKSSKAKKAADEGSESNKNEKAKPDSNGDKFVKPISTSIQNPRSNNNVEMKTDNLDEKNESKTDDSNLITEETQSKKLEETSTNNDRSHHASRGIIKVIQEELVAKESEKESLNIETKEIEKESLNSEIKDTVPVEEPLKEAA